MYIKKNTIKLINLIVFFLCLNNYSFAISTDFEFASPPFTYNIIYGGVKADSFDLNIQQLPYSDLGKIIIQNLDIGQNRSIDIRIKPRIYINNLGKEGWIKFPYEVVNVDPGLSRELQFSVNIPTGVCDGYYEGKIILDLIDYDNLGFQGFGSGVSYSRNINFNINTGNVCNINLIQNGLSLPSIFEYNFDSALINIGEESFNNLRTVYHDFDGDQVYEPNENDVPIDIGFAYLYDSNNNLISATDLSLTNGVYETPDYLSFAPQNFYMIILNDKWDAVNSSIKDKLWEGNLFVDRKGLLSDLQNIFVFENIINYVQITSNIDVRSRNTDQQGIWDDGTITVGPDDKDQVISPIRWDYLVEGTDFPYVDLDHDGRIDPDDKDHIISPLYWDFPN